jgi:hypothetical protein
MVAKVVTVGPESLVFPTDVTISPAVILKARQTNRKKDVRVRYEKKLGQGAGSTEFPGHATSRSLHSQKLALFQQLCSPSHLLVLGCLAIAQRLI